jgi:hypothetical protein
MPVTPEARISPNVILVSRGSEHSILNRVGGAQASRTARDQAASILSNT